MKSLIKYLANSKLGILLRNSLKIAPVNVKTYENNKKGKSDGEFNNRNNYHMAQEQLPDDSTLWGPYGYVNDKQEFKILISIYQILILN